MRAPITDEVLMRRQEFTDWTLDFYIHVQLHGMDLHAARLREIVDTIEFEPHIQNGARVQWRQKPTCP